MKIEAVVAFPDGQIAETLELPTGATVADAVGALSAHSAFAGFELDALAVGVWGEKCTGDRVLIDGDRLEFYRPLLLDPKERRRREATRQAKSKD